RTPPRGGHAHRAGPGGLPPCGRRRSPPRGRRSRSGRRARRRRTAWPGGPCGWAGSGSVGSCRERYPATDPPGPKSSLNRPYRPGTSGVEDVHDLGLLLLAGDDLVTRAAAPLLHRLTLGVHHLRVVAAKAARVVLEEVDVGPPADLHVGEVVVGPL